LIAFFPLSQLNDLRQKLEEFVGILAQLMFAKEIELGWDDSIIRIAPSMYKIRVGDEWYKTSKVLSNQAAEDLTGHASRVWLATIGETAKEVAIKESWQGFGSEAEDEVQTFLFSKAVELELDEVKQHFFTLRSHERIKIDGKEDTTSETILRGLNTKNLPKLKIQRRTDNGNGQIGVFGPSYRSSLSAAHGAGPLPSRPIKSNRRIDESVPNTLGPTAPLGVRHRYHYRIVMEEVGKPVWLIDNLEHALTAYVDTLVGE
jgi:hypothetical protein